jgi:hypothetical protein
MFNVLSSFPSFGVVSTFIPDIELSMLFEEASRLVFGGWLHKSESSSKFFDSSQHILLIRTLSCCVEEISDSCGDSQ